MQAADHTCTLFSYDFHAPVCLPYVRCQAALAEGCIVEQRHILAGGPLCLVCPDRAACVRYRNHSCLRRWANGSQHRSLSMDLQRRA